MAAFITNVESCGLSGSFELVVVVVPPDVLLLLFELFELMIALSFGEVVVAFVVLESLLQAVKPVTKTKPAKKR